MSRTTTNWLRAAAFPDRVRKTAGRDVTAVLPETPVNGQYPPWVYVCSSFLVYLDYLLVVTVSIGLLFLLAAGNAPLFDGTIDPLWLVVGLAAAIHLLDSGLARTGNPLIDRAVAGLLSPFSATVEGWAVTIASVSPPSYATAVGGRTAADPPAPENPYAMTPYFRVETVHEDGPFETWEHDPPLAEGDTFESYRLGPEIGRGALSYVWKAEDTRSGDTVALKVFDRTVDEGTRRSFASDFLHEARVLEVLRDHENVITLHEWGEEPVPWIAVEYVATGTLRNHLPVPLPQALETCLALSEAIEYAHSKGIAHSDIKPANVLYSRDYFGRLILLTDWGKRPIVEPGLEEMLSRPYAAPEQFDGYPTTQSEAELVDIYQLGALAYELFTGHQPFLDTGDTGNLEARIGTELPPAPSDLVPELPDEIDDILLTAMAKEPSDRYRTVGEFRSRLVDVMLPDITPGE